MSDRYNKLYNKDYTKTYIACSRDCKICKIWRKPTNVWRTFEFFPYHCINCEFAGYPDEFYLFNERAFMCYPCFTKANIELKKRFPHLRFLKNK